MQCTKDSSHAFGMTVELWLSRAMKLGMSIFYHAGRELNVEIFDGEFAGDEAGEKRIAARLQTFSRMDERSDLLIYF